MIILQYWSIEVILGTIFVLALLIHILLRYKIYKLPSKSDTDDGDWQTDENAQNKCPSVSVIVYTFNQAHELEQNLEQICMQDYPNFEVIVVNAASNDDTPDVIKRIENRYRNVHHTFVPESARYISPYTLGITLGCKAAKGEWLLLTKGNCCPFSKNWISEMAKAFMQNHNIVLGYSNFQNIHTIRNSRYRLKRMIQQLRFLHAAKSGKAVGGDGTNLAIHRDHFNTHHGFSKVLELIGGEDILFVDRTSKKRSTATVTSLNAKIIQGNPVTSQQWRAKQAIYAEVARHLSRHGKWERLKWTITIIVFGIATLSSVALSLLFWNYKYDVGILAILLIYVVEICSGLLLLNNSSGELGESNCLYLYPFYVVTQPFYDLWYKFMGRCKRRSLMGRK